MAPAASAARPSITVKAQASEATPTAPSRNASDDEILGLTSPTLPRRTRNSRNGQETGTVEEKDVTDHGRSETHEASDLGLAREPRDSRDPDDEEVARVGGRGAELGDEISEDARAALDANPELEQAWEDASAYRESFATPEEAREATALVADLNRLDTLFHSRRPEDHGELARSLASLDPAAFASLAEAMGRVSAELRRANGSGAATPRATPELTAGATQPAATEAPSPERERSAAAAQPTPTAAQAEFFQAANAAAVEGVLQAIESQVERLLPEGISKSARNRVVGEIYRELDGTLRANRQLTQQMREAFRGGALDPEHQRAIVSMITGRARQALPGVAKRVLNEWTTTLLAANHERRMRQRTAEKRVDIAGSGGNGNDGRRTSAPREVDYARMSDADILNL
ncbi:MAG: hypothetical protein WA879_03510 [Candidatus Acidiferrales bacterium]